MTLNTRWVVGGANRVTAKAPGASRVTLHSVVFESGPGLEQEKSVSTCRGVNFPSGHGVVTMWLEEQNTPAHAHRISFPPTAHLHVLVNRDAAANLTTVHSMPWRRVCRAFGRALDLSVEPELRPCQVRTERPSHPSARTSIVRLLVGTHNAKPNESSFPFLKLVQFIALTNLNVVLTLRVQFNPNLLQGEPRSLLLTMIGRVGNISVPGHGVVTLTEDVTRRTEHAHALAHWLAHTEQVSIQPPSIMIQPARPRIRLPAYPPTHLRVLVGPAAAACGCGSMTDLLEWELTCPSEARLLIPDGLSPSSSSSPGPWPAAMVQDPTKNPESRDAASTSASGSIERRHGPLYPAHAQLNFNLPDSDSSRAERYISHLVEADSREAARGCYSVLHQYLWHSTTICIAGRLGSSCSIMSGTIKNRYILQVKLGEIKDNSLRRRHQGRIASRLASVIIGRNGMPGPVRTAGSPRRPPSIEPKFKSKPKVSNLFPRGVPVKQP
ncbi:hypothetical protein C8F04DRAFT_1185750 [Mycena alexandri]|uniref:Uncharacterized protein n=1 Tax=Mycena alexandri TaxID=1745969 RepID=A0AAD6X021_9AGAR|nr:hypothetical protein C8F04DRAFT_1185750 [Mycena alexandri]